MIAADTVRKATDSVSPTSGSRFNFHFWTGKAKETFKGVSKKNPQPTYDHAITTQDRTMSFKPTYQEKTMWTDEDELVSPVFDFTPPFAQRERKNSTSPAPVKLQSASRSTSSDETSPVTPHPNDFYSKRCARCHRDVTGGIPVGDDIYHTQCYSCYTCRNRLDPHSPPLEYQGRLYCDIDYTMLVQKRPNCGACNRPIEPRVRPTRALGRYYHPEHIRCHHCNKPVDPEMTGLVERKGKIFCRPDFNMLYLPKCRACGRAVEKEAVSAADGKLKGKWHKHCFRCHECRCRFPNNMFYVYQNAPYCRRDYHKMNNSLCKKCDEPVEGRCAQTAEGWRFHPNCFTCHICRCLITDVYYMSDGHVFCPQDRQHRSEKRHTYFQEL
ncbi:hypothetical protein BJV82DRAFT_628188 [Fennellomyces sp. T-0311]|nr:hypothetical protein BJV82DRAFT_628188 [Fennellomyces sp. T-0311]